MENSEDRGKGGEHVEEEEVASGSNAAARFRKSRTES